MASAHRSSRRIRFALVTAWLLTLAGCPRDLEVPDRRPGDPCTATAECNPPGTSCGLLTACVDQRCEEQASLVVPCPDGEPVFIPDAGGTE